MSPVTRIECAHCANSGGTACFKSVLICSVGALFCFSPLLKQKNENKEFGKLLEAQENRYKQINEKIEDLAKKHKTELKDNNWFEKIRLWGKLWVEKKDHM